MGIRGRRGQGSGQPTTNNYPLPITHYPLPITNNHQLVFNLSIAAMSSAGW
ncbi:hypothetical protein [Chroococcidiopsis sp. CCNUC1]|uniref:hypothetical protein n=1 Tax=Chroococcidiopsis sp. CCNUC1 TaxID=2653189 RepID=UPI0020228609|nr:hypothetical protein [Chroococcidiopsis sp. CCNUC1]URD48227.1 hypothetical protein M5J74_17980 [Chroococcidiopsis sp. CCNUC1]